jgi:NADPH:quinone reductase-like Zn-dependent oxidoreductase
MKAIVYSSYGTPEVLQFKEVAKPTPGNDELLIKVCAASVNSWDWDRLTGKPMLYRLISGILKPKLKILGADIAGIVDSVGKNIKKFKPGDEVFGDLSEGKWGGFAEYSLARETELTNKPLSMSFEEAAALPQAGAMAVQAIREVKKIHSGYRILMNGAGGGVGTFLIQIAKDQEAHVTAVDSREKFDLLHELGADEVIDYRTVDFTKNNQEYDLIVDVVASRSVFEYKRVLSSRGILTVIGGKIPRILQIALIGSIVSKRNGQKIGILSYKPNKYIEELKELVESGKITPVIDKVYPLSQTAAALQRIGDGRVKGKLIIKM